MVNIQFQLTNKFIRIDLNRIWMIHCKYMQISNCSISSTFKEISSIHQYMFLFIWNISGRYFNFICSHSNFFIYLNLFEVILFIRIYLKILIIEFVERYLWLNRFRSVYEWICSKWITISFIEGYSWMMLFKNLYVHLTLFEHVCDWLYEETLVTEVT
jgi:hypothetical protein